MSNLTYTLLFNVLFFGIGLLAFIRVMNGQNDLAWDHLISSGAKDGKTYADWNKIGQGCGVMVATSMPYIYMYSSTPSAEGLALIMGVSLLYLGGVTSYSTHLKSKNSDVKNIAP